MNKITKTNVAQLERWLRLQTKAFKEHKLSFNNLDMVINNISLIEGIHVSDVRKVAYILGIPEDKLSCSFTAKSEYPYEYWLLFDGVKVFSVYKEDIK